MSKTLLASVLAALLLAGCGSSSIPSTASSSGSSSNTGTNTGTTSVPGTTATGGLAANYKTTVWEDNFANDAPGAPSSTYWAAEVGNGAGAPYNNPGWGNNEAEYYLASDATVAGGTLNLHGFADPSVTNFVCSGVPCTYSSAKITSVQTVDLSKPGFLEVKASLPTVSGAWPAIWLLPGTTPAGNPNATQPVWPIGGEIDMAEWLGKYFSGQDSLVQSTLHLPSPATGGYADNYEYQKITLSSPLSGNFHLYQLAWTPGQIEFAVDNQTVMTCTESSMSCTTIAGGSYPANAIWPYGTTYTQYYLILNLAIGGNLGGTPAANFNQTMQVAYVRYMTP